MAGGGPHRFGEIQKDWTDYIQGGNKIQGVEIRDAVVRVGPAEDIAVFAYVKTKLAGDKKVTAWN